jgi:hypothetical protein
MINRIPHYNLYFDTSISSRMEIYHQKQWLQKIKIQLGPFWSGITSRCVLLSDRANLRPTMSNK